MSFEEEFPSLKGKEIKILRYEAKDDYIGEYSGSDYTNTSYFVHRVIQEHTIDKQRVREALKRYRINAPQVIYEIERELGL